jgi:hypothetical protein
MCYRVIMRMGSDSCAYTLLSIVGVGGGSLQRMH